MKCILRKEVARNSLGLLFICDPFAFAEDRVEVPGHGAPMTTAEERVGNLFCA